MGSAVPRKGSFRLRNRSDSRRQLSEPPATQKEDDMTQFKNDALKQLTDQQVRFAPPTRRQEQLARAEKLLAEIEPKRQYPYQFVCYRVTDYRPDSYGDLLISGEDLKHDLCAFMDELSRSLPVVPVEEVTEKVLTLEQISQQ